MSRSESDDICEPQGLSTAMKRTTSGCFTPANRSSPLQDQRFLPEVFGVCTDTGIAVPAGQCLAFAEILVVAAALRPVRLVGMLTAVSRRRGQFGCPGRLWPIRCTGSSWRRPSQRFRAPAVFELWPYFWADEHAEKRSELA